MPIDLTTDTTLAAVTAARAGRELAEVTQLNTVLDWAAAHTATDSDDRPARYDDASFGDQFLSLAGPGAPEVGEFATIELAAALRMSTDSGKAYVAKALELQHRLPRVHARVNSGELLVWKAFQIAEQTISLPLDGAAHVDRHLAPVAHKLSFAQLERTVDEARVSFDPDEAEARRAAAADGRRFDVHLRHAGLAGTVDVTGTLDLADAVDLEKAVQAGAAQLAAAGCEEPLDVRRSMAVGEMARHQLAFDYETGSTTSGGRSVVVYVHLSDSAVTGVAGVDNTHTDVLVTQIASWCGSATKVIIKPVLDLAACDPVTSYDIPDRTKEHVDLRDRHCVFPYCTRPAPGCDHDHITPWPQGQTCGCQIAPLCRRHHRAKTHAAWTYVSINPGVYRWRSPHGLTFVRDHHGTTPT